jgi:hypothetical protein
MLVNREVGGVSIRALGVALNFLWTFALKNTKLLANGIDLKDCIIHFSGHFISHRCIIVPECVLHY